MVFIKTCRGWFWKMTLFVVVCARVSGDGGGKTRKISEKTVRRVNRFSERASTFRAPPAVDGGTHTPLSLHDRWKIMTNNTSDKYYNDLPIVAECSRSAEITNVATAFMIVGCTSCRSCSRGWFARVSCVRRSGRKFSAGAHGPYAGLRAGGRTAITITATPVSSMCTEYNYYYSRRFFLW